MTKKRPFSGEGNVMNLDHAVVWACPWFIGLATRVARVERVWNVWRDKSPVTTADDWMNKQLCICLFMSRPKFSTIRILAQVITTSPGPRLTSSLSGRPSGWREPLISKSSQVRPMTRPTLTSQSKCDVVVFAVRRGDAEKPQESLTKPVCGRLTMEVYQSRWSSGSRD